jgi:hypothetical protein
MAIITYRRDNLGDVATFGGSLEHTMISIDL